MCLYVCRVYTTCIDHSSYVRLYVCRVYTICIDHSPYVRLYVTGVYTTCIDHLPYVCLYMFRVYSTCILRSVASSTYGRNFQDGRQAIARDRKERFSCLFEKHSRYYNCRTQLTLISSHGTFGLPEQQNLNSRSIFLTLSRCQNLQFYLI